MSKSDFFYYNTFTYYNTPEGHTPKLQKKEDKVRNTATYTNNRRKITGQTRWIKWTKKKKEKANKNKNEKSAFYRFSYCSAQTKSSVPLKSF